jgi:endonuclease/exonuclease/phosphatase family metal-dependent hydrolase
MKVLTWNTHLGYGTAAAIAYATRTRADVILLQEARSPQCWSGQYLGSTVLHREWGSWILTSFGELEEISIADYSGWVAGAKWLRQGVEPLFLFSIHSPTRNANERRRSYVAESLNIVAAIDKQVPSNARLIIGGDFNFKSLGERQLSEQIQVDRAEGPALKKFRQRGFSIVWRDVHPREPLPQTLRWKRAPTRHYHCDGFLTRGFDSSSITCEVICSEDETKISDHNPVILQC